MISLTNTINPCAEIMLPFDATNILRKINLNSYYGQMHPPAFHKSAFLNAAKMKNEVKKLSNGEWEVFVVPEQYDDIVEWMTKALGPPGQKKKFRWKPAWASRYFLLNHEIKQHGSRFYFTANSIKLRNAADVTLFTLRWVE